VLVGYGAVHPDSPGRAYTMLPTNDRAGYHERIELMRIAMIDRRPLPSVAVPSFWDSVRGIDRSMS